MKVPRSLALVLAGALLAAGCGDSSPEPAGQGSAPSTAAGTADPAATGAPTSPAPPSTGPATAASPPSTTPPDLGAALDGRTFRSTAVDGFTLVEGTQIELTFEGQDIGARAGCNHLGSTWSLEGDVLVTPDMSQTEMACDPPALMDQDAWLAAVLTSRPTLALAGDTLTVSAQGATVTLVDEEVADPDRALEGPTWTLETVVSGDVASSVPAGVRPPTLRFDGAAVAVDTGCNTGSGGYRVVGGTIELDPIVTTRMACADPAGGDVEQAVLAVLTGTAAVELDADVLTLTNGAAGLVLRATP